jgi:putative FmdB family regulatory protein
MPTYEYGCENGHLFEEFQSIVADPINVCPICGGRAERKISGGTGLIFRGSGFYITDYARKSGGDSGNAKSASKPKPPASDSPSSTSDPASSTPASGTKE